MTSKKKEDKGLKLQKEVNDLLEQLNAVINKNTFKDHEVDNLWNKIFEKLGKFGTAKAESTSAQLRNQRWSSNHIKIKKAIDDIIRDTYSMPSAYQIAQDTGLSRQTVSKHLREFDTHELYTEELKSYELSSNMLLERILAMAVKGDLKAMKFYINVIDRRKHLEAQRTQNNFIQLNTVYINEASIQALPEAQRQAIEEIILSENLKVLKLDKAG